MEYLEKSMEYFEICWPYLPYVLYTYVCLTFLPKTLRKMSSFAKADYAANCNKYHRCYAPDGCCHPPKQKTRKAITRAYAKKQSTTATAQVVGPASPSAIKRQVQVSAIQTQTNVNQIAKMFESGGATTHVCKQINWVTPTILPEIRKQMPNGKNNDADDLADENFKLQALAENQSNEKKSSKLAQLLQENIENSVNLLNQASEVDLHMDNSWRSEPIVVQRRIRRPNTLNYAGSSVTPSTASPAASSSLSASPVSESPALRFNLNSSLEDIFATIARNAEQHDNFSYGRCNELSPPVTSIEDILAQRRFSRPLSAYSITDLLNDNDNTAGIEESAYVAKFLRKLNTA